LGDRKDIWSVKVGVGLLWGDDLTEALHVLELQLSSPVLSSLGAIKPTNPGLVGQWAFKRRKNEK